MKETALALIRELSDPTEKLNRLREYLQAFMLRSLHESEAFASIAFVGGTALRFLHGLPRFSEDLDFSVYQKNSYEPVKWMEKAKRDLLRSGFQAEIRWNDRKTVHSGWVRISEILKEAGLSAMENQKLSIKVEIDTRPPEGENLQRSLVTRHLTFALRHYDLPSLLAGKLHALISRPYAKGRDWYDLVWHLSHRPPVLPNLELLQNALNQTRSGPIIDANNWVEHLLKKLETLDANTLIDDVEAFLERSNDTALLTHENLTTVLNEFRR